MNRPFTTLAVAAAVALVAPLAPTAHAEQRWAAQSAPRITGFNVDPVAELAPGAELRFTLWGTPGAQALLQIDGARRPLALTEVRPGVYEGYYTVATRDTVRGDSRVSASLRADGRIGTATLDQPLQGGWTRETAQASAADPRIERFDVKPSGDRARGQRLDFRLVGTPGGSATVRVPGTASRLRLDEHRPGEYLGSTLLQPNERIGDREPVVAELRVGQRVATSRLDDAVDLRAGPLPPAARCADCATVIAVNRIRAEGDGNYVGGTVAGGVLGAILGNQVGGGSGKDVARVAGAVGGAVLGREIQKRNDDGRDRYEIVVRMDRDGTQRVVAADDLPPFETGDAVLLRDGVLSPNR